jgi:hypothetical protein
MLINGELLLDFPRPLTNTISYLGSVVTPEGEKRKPLPQEWENIVNTKDSQGTILVSFGTLIRTEYVPDYIFVSETRFIFLMKHCSKTCFEISLHLVTIR